MKRKNRSHNEQSVNLTESINKDTSQQINFAEARVGGKGKKSHFSICHFKCMWLTLHLEFAFPSPRVKWQSLLWPVWLIL